MRLRPEEPEVTGWTVLRGPELRQRIVDLLGEPQDRPAVLAVDGRGASGKSTFATWLSVELPGTVVVHADDLSWNEPFFAWGPVQRGLLEEVRTGGDVRFVPPVWRELGRQGSIDVPADTRLVIVEGTGSAQAMVRPLVDAVVWIQSDWEKAEVRGLARDIRQQDNGNEQQTIAFWHEWMRHEVDFFATDRPWEHADLVLAGTPERRLEPGEFQVAATAPLLPPTARRGRSVRSRPDTVLIGCILAVVGGFLDAYTFWWHGVFANAQTGNVVLIGVNAALGKWQEVGNILPALFAFLAGVLAAHALSTARARRLLRRPTRWVLAAEILVLVLLGFMPLDISTVRLTVAVSFVSALQTSTFKNVGDVPYNTTMTTGNLKTLMAAVFAAVVDRNRAAARRAAVLTGIVTSFTAGALFGTLATHQVHNQASWIAAGLLALVFALLVGETHRLERHADA